MPYEQQKLGDIVEIGNWIPAIGHGLYIFNKNNDGTPQDTWGFLEEGLPVPNGPGGKPNVRTIFFLGRQEALKDTSRRHIKGTPKIYDPSEGKIEYDEQDFDVTALLAWVAKGELTESRLEMLAKHPEAILDGLHLHSQGPSYGTLLAVKIKMTYKRAMDNGSEIVVGKEPVRVGQIAVPNDYGKNENHGGKFLDGKGPLQRFQTFLTEIVQLYYDNFTILKDYTPALEAFWSGQGSTLLNGIPSAADEYQERNEEKLKEARRATSGASEEEIRDNVASTPEHTKKLDTRAPTRSQIRDAAKHS